MTQSGQFRTISAGMVGFFRIETTSSIRNITEMYLLIFQAVLGCTGCTSRISEFRSEKEFRTGIYSFSVFDF